MIVEKSVLNEGAHSDAASVYADLEAQVEISKEFQKQCAALDLLGWNHTHPWGCGAFYSSVDRETQRTWTNPNSIGIVIDPSLQRDWIKVFCGPESRELIPTHQKEIDLIACCSKAFSEVNQEIEFDHKKIIDPEIQRSNNNKKRKMERWFLMFFRAFGLFKHSSQQDENVLDHTDT